MSDFVSTYFEDHVQGGARVFEGRTVTAEDIDLHAAQTGDYFPHHMDADWCATQPFGRRMAHGTLVLSIAVGMTADDVNPAAMSYGYDRIRFVRPVFIGDTISVRAEISSLRDYPKAPTVCGLVDEELRVTNQHGEVVLALVHIYLVNRAQLPGPQERRSLVDADSPDRGQNANEQPSPLGGTR